MPNKKKGTSRNKVADKRNFKYKEKQTPKQKNEGSNIPETNDPKWYGVDANMIKDVASIPFNHIPGTEFPRYTFPEFREDVVAMPSAETCPGILTVRYVPGPGSSHSATSGINMAARQLYSFIRRANSGARNYEAPDLMMYLLAMESIYLAYFEARRAYALAQTYFYMNRNMPDLIIRSLRVDPVDLRENLANYRYQLNLLREQINSMAVPKGFYSFERRAFVASAIFADSDSMRGGIYAMFAQGYYKYNPVKYDSGGCCEYTEIPTSSFTLQSRINMIKDMLSVVITDDDMNTMSGDVIKAFGENGLYSVTDVPENLTCYPVYDQNVLAQIENARCVIPQPDVTWGLDIAQKNNVLFWRPMATTSEVTDYAVAQSSGQLRNSFVLNTNYTFNSHVDHPTAEQVLEWTRLAPTIDVENTLPAHCAISCGLEIPVAFEICAINPNGGSDLVQNVSSVLPLDITVATMSTVNPVTGVSWLAQFDWHPNVVFCYFDRPTMVKSEAFPLWTGKYNLLPDAMDVKVYTHINYDVLTRMHTCANYSVYYIRGLF